MEDFLKLLTSGGTIRGRSPPKQKMGFLKAEGLFSGWVGKMKKNKYFQNYWTKHKNFKVSFKIFVWQESVKYVVKVLYLEIELVTQIRRVQENLNRTYIKLQLL
jgi:hypothetical protein